VGRLRGGAYYFYEERFGDWEIQKVLSDKETCNPKICEVCEYSSNGKRDAARSITMCDGCRYNEEFKLNNDLEIFMGGGDDQMTEEEKKNKLMQDLFEWELWGRQKLLDECSLGHYSNTICGYPNQSRKKKQVRGS